VTGAAFQVLRLAEIEPLSGGAEVKWLPLRTTLGISAFGVNAFRGEPGEQVIEEHDETGSGAGRHEELYLVVSGRARFAVAGEELQAPAGTLVFVSDPAAQRGAIAEEPGTTVLVVGGKVGEAFRPSAWEFNFLAANHLGREEYDRARELLAAGLEAHPVHPGILYNLACLESLTGEPDAALDHLRQAVERDARFREYARDDRDFDSIRDRREFEALVAAG
jgi:tetratricopeptide (TPR) repeat protein